MIHFSPPVYLYGEAAAEEKRRLLPSVRAGEYEGLVEKVSCSTDIKDLVFGFILALKKRHTGLNMKMHFHIS